MTEVLLSCAQTPCRVGAQTHAWLSSTYHGLGIRPCTHKAYSLSLMPPKISVSSDSSLLCSVASVHAAEPGVLLSQYANHHYMVLCCCCAGGVGMLFLYVLPDKPHNERCQHGGATDTCTTCDYKAWQVCTAARKPPCCKHLPVAEPATIASRLVGKRVNSNTHLSISSKLLPCILNLFLLLGK